jgi:hypothetical protein
LSYHTCNRKDNPMNTGKKRKSDPNANGDPQSNSGDDQSQNSGDDQSQSSQSSEK